MNLPYTGLQGPKSQGSKLTKREILQFFSKKGYDHNSLNYLRKHLSKTNEVKISKNKRGLFVNGVFFPFRVYSKGMNDPYPQGGNNGTFNPNGNSSPNFPNQQDMPNDKNSVDWKKILETVSEIISWLSKIFEFLKNLLSGCYNATWPPKKGKEKAKEYLEELQERMEEINDIASSKGIRNVMDKLNMLSNDAVSWMVPAIKTYDEGGWHKCSKDTIEKIIIPMRKKGIEMVNRFAKELLDTENYTYKVTKKTGYHSDIPYEYNYYVLVRKTSNNTNNGSGNHNVQTKKGGALLPLAGLAYFLLNK